MKVGIRKFSQEKLGVRVRKAEDTSLGHRVYQFMAVAPHEVWLHTVPLPSMRYLHKHLLNSTSFLTSAQVGFFLTKKMIPFSKAISYSKMVPH